MAERRLTMSWASRSLTAMPSSAARRFWPAQWITPSISGYTSVSCCSCRSSSGLASSRCTGETPARFSNRSGWRVATITRAPHSTSGPIRAWPMPPVPPSSRKVRSCSLMALLLVAGRQRNAVQHVAVKAIHHAGRLDDGLLVFQVGNAVHQVAEKLEVLLVQRAVGIQIAEGLVRQAQLLLDGFAQGRGQFDGGAFQYLNHAEKGGRVAALDAVVQVSHHQLDGGIRLAMADGFLVFTTGFQIGQDALVVAVFFLDVFHQRLAHKLQALRQAALAGDQRWDRVLHVVVGVGQKPRGAFKVTGTLLDGVTHAGSGATGPGVCGFGLQSVKKRHVRDCWGCLLG